jgi:hypothetical protein
MSQSHITYSLHITKSHNIVYKSQSHITHSLQVTKSHSIQFTSHIAYSLQVRK